MILPDFILPNFKDLILTESGLDSHSHCLNKAWFETFPHVVQYSYNSRGFRDSEWPATEHELRSAIWCIGDSFTAGLGSPLAHSWVNILQQNTNQRCINVSLDGASNEWIARKALRVLSEIQPKKMVIQWSYFSRGELTDDTLHDEDRRIPIRDDITSTGMVANFIRLFNQVDQAANSGQVIHSLIPNARILLDDYPLKWARLAGSGWPKLPTTAESFNNLPKFVIEELNTAGELNEFTQVCTSQDWRQFDALLAPALGQAPSLVQVSQLDYARDYHHYDVKTARNFINSISHLVSN